MLIRPIFLVLIIAASSLSGCIAGEQRIDDGGVIAPDPIKIAFSIKDDYSNFDENPYRLADYLSQQIGKPVELYPITSDALALEALRFGSADMAFMDGGAGWVGWQKYGLQVAAADMKSDGKTYYQAHAWVLNGSDVADALQDGNESTDPFALLQGKTSCHTGWLKSAGMLIPMGYLIGNNYTEVIGDAEDIESLRNTIFNFFNDDASIPESGTPYYGYSEYEASQLDNRIKITNLPKDVKIRIYTVSGTLIRTIKKSDNLTSSDWDLKNDHGIPVASGLYIIHVDAEGVGEKILKWFGVLRPIDLDTF